MLEFGKDLLDRVEVGAVGRQEDEVGAACSDGGAGRLALVTAEVVQHDDISRRQRRSQDLLHIEPEELAVYGAVNDPGRVDAVMAQSGDEGQGLPVAEGRAGLQALALGSQPRRGAMLDFTQVSSMSTRRSGAI